MTSILADMGAGPPEVQCGTERYSRNAKLKYANNNTSLGEYGTGRHRLRDLQAIQCRPDRSQPERIEEHY